jgi:nicotinamidase-related amidase
VELDPATTAVLVLDLSTRCSDPAQVCREIAPAVARFVDRARARGVPIVYTVSAAARGTALGDVWEGFNRRPDEPVLYPDGFDKFVDGELQGVLVPRGITTLVITGSSTNVSVMYTGTAAARLYGYDVVVPIDGVNTDTDYQQEYALYQLSVLPNVGNRFRFTTLDGVSFAGR